jgi:hypothetical protein
MMWIPRVEEGINVLVVLIRLMLVLVGMFIVASLLGRRLRLCREEDSVPSQDPAT